MAAVPVGVDLPAALRVGEVLGYDLVALALLLPMAEGAIANAVQERLKSETKG